MLISHFSEDLQVLIDIDCRQVLVEARLGDEWVSTLSWHAPNLSALSEAFRDQVGYGVAVRVLEANDVAKESPLWTLGHKGGLTHWTSF